MAELLVELFRMGRADGWHYFTPRADHHDICLSGRIDRSLICVVYLVIAEWLPYNPHGLHGTRFPGLDLYCTDPAQPLTTAGEELDHLQIDHDLSETCKKIGARATTGAAFFGQNIYD